MQPGPARAGGGKVISTHRRVIDLVFFGGCSVALLFVLAPVLWLIIGVVKDAVSGWHWSVLTEATSGIGGGLSQAIVGSLVIMAGVGIIAGGVGVAAGIWLSEMTGPGKIPTVLRAGSEILAGIPSIVFGYCGYLTMVVGLHWGYSLLPAVIVVSMLVVPYVMKATELSLGQVPLAYREGGEALGMSTTYVLRKIVLRSAVPGILTGLVIALAISVGETAPLLYTAGWTTKYPSFALVHNAVGYLTYPVYTFLDEPVQGLKVLAFDAAFLVLILVLILIVCSRLLVRASQRYSPNRTSGGGRAELRAARQLSQRDPRVSTGG